MTSTLHGLPVRHQFMPSPQPGRPVISLPHHELTIAAVQARGAGAMSGHVVSVGEGLRTLDVPV